jgi:transcriptional regulator with XRE-family HTH domain
MIMGLVERVKSKIKKLIKQKGLSIYELAEKSDLTEACIRNWYTKRNYTPSLEAIEKICLALEVTETELVRREDEELIPATLDERDLIKNWLLLDEKQKQLVLMQIDAFLNK